ncbi:MAG: FmdB family transcriptional regulator [Planctomycetota bacterium]|nr:FmdB family transcriptional regulator [Planctomycetota bacterium]MDA1251199.1 FmdB family transcriptional regulator [Planctomycetota bacterium]
MPVYVYQVVREDGKPGAQFEIRQGIHDKALTHHPETGEPIKRVIQAAFVAGSHSQMAIDKKLKDPKKLEQMGFTKYEKTSDGYIKTAGKGPDLINRDGKTIK